MVAVVEYTEDVVTVSGFGFVKGMVKAGADKSAGSTSHLAGERRLVGVEAVGHYYGVRVDESERMRTDEYLQVLVRSGRYDYMGPEVRNWLVSIALDLVGGGRFSIHWTFAERTALMLANSESSLYRRSSSSLSYFHFAYPIYQEAVVAEGGR